jgi:type I restriction enzyme S subunit
MDGSRVGRNRAQIKKIDLPLILAQRVARLRAKNEFSQDFLAYVIKSDAFERYIDAVKTGTSIPHISPQQIKEFEFLAPSKKEQDRIASILSSLDEKIELNRQMNETLEETARALFKEWFVNFNFPGDDGKRVSTELGDVPKGWKVRPINSFCNLSNHTLSKKTALPFIDYIEIGEVNKGIIGNITRYEVGTEPSRARRILKHGETVLSTVRPDRGAYFLAWEPDSTLIASTGFAVLSPTHVPYSFLYILLTDNKMLEYYGHVADGGAYPAINPDIILEMKVVVPDKEILREFHSIVNPLFERINQNQSGIKYLSGLRNTLLPKLMKGEIEV